MLAKMLTIFDHIGRVKTQKPPIKGYFVDGELVRKTFNVTTTNTILMKLAMIMYLMRV